SRCSPLRRSLTSTPPAPTWPTPSSTPATCWRPADDRPATLVPIPGTGAGAHRSMVDAHPVGVTVRRRRRLATGRDPVADNAQAGPRPAAHPATRGGHRSRVHRGPRHLDLEPEGHSAVA